MNKPSSRFYNSLRAYLDEVPVIDTHEHYFSTTDTHPLEVMTLIDNSFYTNHDLCSVSIQSAKDFKNLSYTLENQFAEPYDIFKKAYDKARHTSYFKGTARGLKECWGLEKIDRQSLIDLQKHIMSQRDNEFYQTMMEKYKIRIKILDTCNPDRIAGFSKTGMLEGFSSYCRFAFPLTTFHDWFGNSKKIPDMLNELTGLPVKNLDEFISAFETFLKACVKAGIVCMKDQSAYSRIIRFENVTRQQADAIYAKLTAGGSLSYDESLSLSNWSMRFYMTMARKYKLPVQIHTGHMAGLYNDVSKANAIHLISLLNDFRDVHFDLFHGNWPYMGEYLFLGKNYPNVSLDLCWVQSIDCEYSVELMKRAVMTLPHNKVLAFGGDSCLIENTVGYLCQARDNVAYALSSLMECGWLSMEDAKEIACDWFYNNPNEIFKLGLEKCEWECIGGKK